VPVDGPSNGLRKLTSRNELPRYRGVLRSRPTPLVGDYRERQLSLSERWKQSSFRARCELVRDLTASSWQKPLTESSGVLLRIAHDVLCEEWAAAEGLSLMDATQEVEALLLACRKAFEKQ
jgi:RNA polymerase-interacting CarD/CdnL/TRCF family regulator